MTIEHHTFAYDRNFFDDKLIAACSCGWESRRTSDTIEDAQERWDEHREAVFIEATETAQSGRQL